MKVRKIYLAGPLFTSAERLWNEQVATGLGESGYDIFLPQEEEPEGGRTPKAIFAMDRNGVDWSDCVVAIMDGADPDSGTCWEVGYAYAKNKLILQIRTDFRTAGDTAFCPYNLMLSESASGIRLLPFGTVKGVVATIVDFLKDYQ